jgi:hypothetical protein
MNMTFEPKISGTKVTGFDIEPLFNGQVVTLREVIAMDLSQESMNWILDTLRFYKGTNREWVTTMDYDSIYKLSVNENYPEYVEEFKKQFGENWMNHYIRFGH